MAKKSYRQSHKCSSANKILQFFFLLFPANGNKTFSCTWNTYPTQRHCVKWMTRGECMCEEHERRQKLMKIQCSDRELLSFSPSHSLLGSVLSKTYVSLSPYHCCHSSNFALLWGIKIIAWFLILQRAQCIGVCVCVWVLFFCYVFHLYVETIAAYWIQIVTNANNVRSFAKKHHTFSAIATASNATPACNLLFSPFSHSFALLFFVHVHSLE